MKRLLIRPGAIGDVILSLPALELARADYTEVWVPRNVVPLIRFADGVRALPDTGIDWIGVVEDERADRALAALGQFDSIYSWYGTAREDFRQAVHPLPFEFFPALPPPPGVAHILTPEAPRDLGLIIHPFASSPAKRWPLEQFQAVAAEFPKTEWCAGPEDPLANAQRFGDLYELACRLARARVFLGNDSGISHLAAAVGTPVVAIFLASDPAVWAPRSGSAAGRVTVLVRPSAAEVIGAVRQYLS